MSKNIIFYILILSGVLGFSQSEKVILSNQVEVEFVKEKRKGTKIVLDIEKPKCFQDAVSIATIDKVLEDYSNRSSYLKNKVRFFYDRIEYETDGGFEKAVLDLKNFIQYFNIGSSKVYLSELTRFSKENSIEEGGMVEYVINKKYPYYSYPFLEKNITSKKIKQLSEDYKNAIGTNNIKITLFGKGNEKQAVKTLEKSLSQLDLGEVNLDCGKVKVSNSFLIYKPFSDVKDGIQTYSIYTQNSQVDPHLEGALKQTFGDENVTIRDFDNFFEVHIVQKTESKDGKALLDKLKAFSKSNQLDYDKFGTIVSGDANGIFESFKNEDITYLNVKDETIANPFVYKSIDLTGKEIVDKYLDAVGSKEAIKSIQNTRAKYDVVVNNDTLNLKVEFLNVLPHRKLRKMILNDEDISYNIFDGYRGWINKKGVIIDYDKEQIAQALAEETVFPQQFYSSGKIVVEGLVVEEDEKYKDQRFNKIKVSLDDYIVYEYYNPYSGLLMKREFCKEAHTPIKTVYYGSYAKINDLVIPHRLRILENNQELKLTLVSYKFNSFIESDEFAKIDHFKLPEEENYIDRFQGVEETKSVGVNSSSSTLQNNAVSSNKIEVKNGHELSNPFEGVEMTKDQIAQRDRVNQHVENQRKIDENRVRVTKYLLVLSTMEDQEGANIMLKRLKRKGFDQAENLEMNGYYYTIEGVYATKEEAQKRLNKIYKRNKGTWILEREY